LTQTSEREHLLPELFIEGDFVESLEGLIFDVKGLVHPPDKIVAFVRYVPDPLGDRRRGSIRYRKIYELSERYSFLRQTAPEYLVHDLVFDEDLIEVPRQRILRHHEPLKKTHELLRSAETILEQKTVEMISLMASASSVPKEEFGVSGSMLVGLAGPDSDIDIVVYGSERCHRVRQALTTLLTEGDEFKPYGEEKAQTLYRSRHGETGISFADYARCELRKDFQGYFKGTDFFVRYVKDSSEIDEEYGSVRYRALGYGKLEGIVSGDDEAIFTPCTYPLRDVHPIDFNVEPPREVVSFRGQFCEQARKEERIIAQGKLEQRLKSDKAYNRLLLGNTRRDFMVAYPYSSTDE